jgi:two-component system, NtrC family, response regulator HydG
VPKILLVDDDVQSLESTRKILEYSGYEVVTVSDGQSALERIRPEGGVKHSFDLVVTDVRMPRLGGLEFLRALSLCGETVPVILMTAFGRVEDAVWAMKLGAVDFLTKPFKRQALLQSIELALKRVRTHVGSESGSSGLLVGRSKKMQELRSQIQQIAPTQATVLISGESGTGKELVARCLHQQSTRAAKPLIALNCAAVPESLIEAELFGFERGAFTGAFSSKPGLFEAAEGGVLFLDEIGDMPPLVQAKLLRVLQEGEIRRVGATVSRKIDVRIFAATHRDLKEEVRAGRFREDLLFRLEVVSVEVPPLRDRSEDLSELALHFLSRASGRHGKQVIQVESNVFQLLEHHTWPGNVRELSNVIERAVVFSAGDVLQAKDLPPHLTKGREEEVRSGAMIEVRVGTALKDVEDLMIRKTLEATSGDKEMTAKLLGVHSRTIYRRLEPKKPS